MRRTVLVLHPRDNVATALMKLLAGEQLRAEQEADTATVCAQEAVPFGHKVALTPIARGEPVRKYGEVIGLATTDIAPGQHVHVHNVESQRGRGDLARSSPSGGAAE